MIHVDVYNELREKYNALFKQHQALLEKHERIRDAFEAVAPSSRVYDLEEGDVCEECNGSGYKTYGSSSTWRGGIGGQTLTTSVCDKCWGSGSKSRPWPSWRKYEELERNQK